MTHDARSDALPTGPANPSSCRVPAGGYFLLTLTLTLMLIIGTIATAQDKGPADALWPLYQEGRFEEVVTRGKALLATGTETAAVNLAVGRSLVDLERPDEGLPYLEKAVGRNTIWAAPTGNRGRRTGPVRPGFCAAMPRPRATPRAAPPTA